MATSIAQAQSSAHYAIPKLVENNGSGFRSGPTHQITSDTISGQLAETSTSAGGASRSQAAILPTSKKR